MAQASITIPVDADTARIYRKVPTEERNKLRLFLSLTVRDFAESRGSLAEVMDRIAEKARERGFTQEVLEHYSTRRASESRDADGASSPSPALLGALESI